MTDLPEKPKERHRAQLRWTQRGGHVDLEGAGGIALGIVVVLAIVGFAAYTGLPLFPILKKPPRLPKR